jgi:hypothetical protein
VLKENAVKSNSITAGILHLFNENKKYDVEAFTIINMGCIGVIQ